MKKQLTGVILIALFCMMPRGAHATTPVLIDGIVYKKGVPAAGYVVYADCSNQFAAQFVGSGTSNASGYYAITTDTAQCPLGWKVDVRVDQDGDGKAETSAIGVSRTHTTINIVLGVNIDVPEYGWIGATLAAGTGLGAIMLLRRRLTKETL